MDKKKKGKRKKWFICLVGILLICGAVFMNSSPLSQKGEVSLENLVYCSIQVTEVKNETGYVRGTKIRDIEQVEKLFDFLGEQEVRRALPWEKLHSDEEYPYTIDLQYDSETQGRYEFIFCWKNGQIDFREKSYMITEEPKTQMTERLELLLQTYETEE